MLCGECQSEITDPDALEVREGRCLCGQRAVTPLSGGKFVHAEGCEGGNDCPCWATLRWNWIEEVDADEPADEPAEPATNGQPNRAYRRALRRLGRKRGRS